MKVVHNGESVKLSLTFADISNVSKKFKDIAYDEHFNWSSIATMFKLSASSKSNRNIIKCYGIIYNEAAIENTYGDLDRYVDFLYNKERNPDRLDEMRALNVLSVFSDQYRTTRDDPEFMSKLSGGMVSCIVHIDKFIIQNELRNKGYGRLIWSSLADLFAEYNLAARYMTTIVYPLNLNDAYLWRPGTHAYDNMYRTMAGLIESIGFIPCTYNVMAWPGIIHIKQFNDRLPVSDEHKDVYNRNEHSIYASIMNKNSE